MRKRFEQQPFLDYIAIKDIDFDDARKSGRLEQLYRTLKEYLSHRNTMKDYLRF